MAFARVQGIAPTDTGATTSTTLAVTISAVGTGNAIVGLVSWDGVGSVTLSSVTDNQGNTYNLETLVDNAADVQRNQAFSRTNITNGPVTITANFSATIGYRAIIVEEFSGGSTASTDERDGTSHGGAYQAAPGTGTDAITSGSFTTVTNGDLIWGADMGITTIMTAGTGFTAGSTTATPVNLILQSEYRTQTTAGSTAATFTQAAAQARVTYMIALKAAGGATDTLMGQIWM